LEIESLEPYILREEATKFWECGYCDELIYLNQGDNINICFPFFSFTKKNASPWWWELWMRGRNGYLYCAIVEPFVGATRNGWDIHFRHHSSHWDNTVLCNITKGIKDIKRMCLTSRVGWPCHIRLQAFDDSTGSLRYVPKNTIEFSPSIAVGVSVVTNGELDTLRFNRDFTSTFDEGKLPEQVIQTRPKIIQEITSQKPKAQVGRFCHLQHNDIPLILSIEVGDGNTWLARIKNFQGLVESLQMFCRPIKLQPYVIARNHMLYYPYGEESGKETKDSKG